MWFPFWVAVFVVVCNAQTPPQLIPTTPSGAQRFQVNPPNASSLLLGNPYNSGQVVAYVNITLPQDMYFPSIDVSHFYYMLELEVQFISIFDGYPASGTANMDIKGGVNGEQGATFLIKSDMVSTTQKYKLSTYYVSSLLPIGVNFLQFRLEAVYKYITIKSLKVNAYQPASMQGPIVFLAQPFTLPTTPIELVVGASSSPNWTAIFTTNSNQVVSARVQGTQLTVSSPAGTSNCAISLPNYPRFSIEDPYILQVGYSAGKFTASLHNTQDGSTSCSQTDPSSNLAFTSVSWPVQSLTRIRSFTPAIISAIYPNFTTINLSNGFPYVGNSFQLVSPLNVSWIPARINLVANESSNILEFSIGNVVGSATGLSVNVVGDSSKNIVINVNTNWVGTMQLDLTYVATNKFKVNITTLLGSQTSDLFTTPLGNARYSLKFQCNVPWPIYTLAVN